MFSEDHYDHLRLHPLFFFNLAKSLSQKLLCTEAISTFIIFYYFLNNLSVTGTSRKPTHIRSCCTTIIRTKEFHNTLQCKINTWNSGFAEPKPLQLTGKKAEKDFLCTTILDHWRHGENHWRHGEKDLEEGYKNNKTA